MYRVHAQRLSPFPDRTQDTSVVLDLATHDIDVMRYLLQADVERVYAEIGRVAPGSGDDLLSGLLRFRGGVIGVLDVDWVTPTKVRHLMVTGEKGMYLVDYLTQDVHWYKNSSVTGTWEVLGVLRSVKEGDMVRLHIQKQEPLRAELESFVECVLEDKEPQVNGQDGLAAVELARMLVESSGRHAPIDLISGAERAS